MRDIRNLHLKNSWKTDKSVKSQVFPVRSLESSCESQYGRESHSLGQAYTLQRPCFSCLYRLHHFRRHCHHSARCLCCRFLHPSRLECLSLFLSTVALVRRFSLMSLPFDGSASSGQDRVDSRRALHGPASRRMILVFFLYPRYSSIRYSHYAQSATRRA